MNKKNLFLLLLAVVGFKLSAMEEPADSFQVNDFASGKCLLSDFYEEIEGTMMGGTFLGVPMSPYKGYFSFDCSLQKSRYYTFKNMSLFYSSKIMLGSAGYNEKTFEINFKDKINSAIKSGELMPVECPKNYSTVENFHEGSLFLSICYSRGPMAYFGYLANINAEGKRPDGEKQFKSHFAKELYVSDFFSGDGPKFMRDTLIEALSAVYKIHLQISMDHLPEFMASLIKEGNQDGLFRDNIVAFKAINGVDNERYLIPSAKNEFHPLPVMVLYVKDFRDTTLNDRNKLLTEILDYLDTFVNDFCEKKGINISELSFKDGNCKPIEPRFNRHIKHNVIYLAGGNADYKLDYKNSLGSHKDTVFTEDMAFFRGWEYERV